MKLAFWRRDEVIEPLIEVRRTGDGTVSAPALDAAAAWLEEFERNLQPRLVAAPNDVDAKLAEVTVERDELLAALDEHRPAPDAEELGRHLQTAWFANTGGTRSYRERWTAVAETAIDAVRGLWPAPADEPAPVAEPAVPEWEYALLSDLARVGDPDPTVAERLAVAERVGGNYLGCESEDIRWCCTRPLDHTGQHVAGTNQTVSHVWPNETSPGNPGPSVTPADDRAGDGSPRLPGDTTSTAGAVEPPVPAVAPPAGTGTGCEVHAVECQCGATIAELANDVDEHLERLAIRLAVTAGTTEAGTWHLHTPAYREVYRRLATEVALAGWLPPGTSTLAGDIASLSVVLTDHELLVDDTCRCGWAGSYADPNGDSPFEMWPLWHAEHVAGHLLQADIS